MSLQFLSKFQQMKMYQKFLLEINLQQRPKSNDSNAISQNILGSGLQVHVSLARGGCK